METARVKASRREIARFYDRIAPFYRLVTLMDNRPKAEAVEIAAPRRKERVLCIGFGRGEELDWFRKAGCTTFGLDISRKMTHGKKDVIVGDGSRPPFRDSTFDLVFCSFFLDLIDTPELVPTLREIKRVLKKGGRLVSLSNTLPSSLKSRVMYSSYMLLKNLFFPSAGIRPIKAGPLFSKAGLSNVRVTPLYWSLEVTSASKH